MAFLPVETIRSLASSRPAVGLAISPGPVVPTGLPIPPCTFC
jgi:hypothetical protein